MRRTASAASSSWLRKMKPMPRYVPLHVAAPPASANRTFQAGIRVSPASGAAAAPSPGTNLEKSSAGAPKRENNPLVLLTHESGSSDTRHNRFKIWRPRDRPSRNQMTSLVMAALIAKKNEVSKDRLP